MDRSNQIVQHGVPVSSLDAAHANEYFEQFVNASSLKNILGYYRGLIDSLHLRPNVFNLFYPKLRANLTSWRAKALLKKFDSRASHKCYQKGKAAANTRVLVIGGGPCGMRTAIEAQLLGAKVVVVEKRDRFSRNNVLHLWPFVIEDLRMLGAKKFFGKFCAGAIDHISIRQLQCILLKVALLLGVEVHTEVSFETLVEPDANEKIGWRAQFKPANHPVSQYEFDVIIGADGKRNTLQGFSRKEFRGKLAIAITANFINKKTEAEARVEEISGVAFIFNQKFFKDLQEATRIDLENIVYYKDDTHYFVMTAKKHSLIEKGVIKQDFADTEKLLAPENVDKEALQQYAIEAATFSTNYQMPNLEFAVNHYGQPDIAMFDFTSMYAAENASKVVERNGYRLLKILVGDSLLEPFWPTGSGCARGFLSSLDAAWAIRSWSLGVASSLEVLAERESIYRLLAQTTPDNLNKDWKSYTLDPATRYPNFNKTVVLSHHVLALFDTDNPASIERMKRTSNEKVHDIPKKRRRGNLDNEVLLNWLTEQLKEVEGIEITEMGSVFKDGKVLCAIIHHYRPDLLEYSAIINNDAAKNNQIAINILEKDLGIPPVMTGSELTMTEDFLSMASYLTEIYDCFRGEIPHVKHPKLDLPVANTKMSEVSFKTIKTSNIAHPITQPHRPSSRHKHKHTDMVTQKVGSVDRKPRKRRTMEKVGASVEERQKMLEEIASNRAERHNKRKYQRKLQTEQFIKSMQMLQANAKADAQPFEDYAIFLYRQTAPKFEDRVKQIEKQFTYVPDQENRPSQFNRGMGKDEDIAAKIKSLESKFGHRQSVDKKPKDLLRAIGKIETSDWNIKEIEKKILENKMGKPSRAIDKEKVPKWSKEQFLARQNKMEQKHLERQTSEEVKFAEFDQSIKNLDQKLKEGTARELGQNKVASITEKLVGKIPTEQKPPEKTNRQPALPTPNNSEFCHFCKKRVYLMERLSAEGRFFHHGCFKCQYCNVQLRLGSYTFDRDGLYGYRFFCLQHFGMVREESPAKVTRAPSTKRVDRSSPEKKSLGIAGVDLLDKVQTPERIEFSNLSSGHVSSDQEDSLNQIDEDEWTDKNFGASCAEMEDSDEASSSFSDPDSDDEGAYDDALEEPVTKEGTLKWAERWKNSYSRKKRNSHSDEYSSSDQSSYYDSSDVVKKLMSLTRFMRLRFLRCEESDTATEGEEDIRARELRKREVCVEPPIVHTDTGTDTEIVTDESSSESSSEIQNSATEISTDSEFAQDDPTPTREIPSIVLNDMYVNKAKRSGYNPRRKIQVTSRYLQSPLDGKTSKPNIDLKLTPLVPSALPVKKPAPLVLTHPQGYSLNRTQSTGGIAAKVSLELKKKYLLGEASPGNIQKSGSVSTLDTKFKSFHTNISDCQKLLKPSPEISASMQTFCKKLNELKSPVLSPQPSIIFTKEVEQKEDDHKENGDVLDENDIKIEPAVFENESEGRPRSPLHETSIIVPQIDWSKQHDSLTSDSLASSDNENEQKSERFENIPKVEIHAINDDEEIKDEFVPDSLLCVNDEIKTDIESPSIEPLKSISSEKKILNQPKVLPNLESVFPEIHNALHIKHKIHKEREREVPETIVISSGLSSPESLAEQATTALTETELSDWARDEAMLDDFEDGEFEIHIKYPDKDQKPAKMADLLEFDDSTSSYLAKSRKDNVIETVNSVLNVNLDNIEFMDTGTETSSDDGVINSQDGYILLKDEDDFAEDSLNPNINDIVETTNINVLQYPKEETIKKETDLKQADLEPSKHVQDHEEDVSTLIIESGTTTEENTLTDSTVKHVSDITVDKTLVNEINTVDKNENCDLKNDVVEESKQKKMIDNNLEFQEHCQRLQNKIEFSNVKDSIDIRKSRKKSKQDVLQKPDLITEETANIVTPPKNISLNLTPHTPHTPDILYNKDVIKKERDINQKLIQEMVMNKMKAENKSLEKRKRNKAGMSPKSPFELTKSATVINVPLSHPSNVAQTTNKRHSGTYTTPDVLLSSKCPLQTSEDVNVKFIRSETTTTPVRTTPSYSNNHVSPNLDDTPKAPPRYHRSAEEMNRKLEKLKQTVRLRHKENEQLVHIKEKTDSASQKRDQTFRRCVSGNYEAACPTFSSLEQSSLSSNRAKSIPNFSQQITTVQTISLDPERIKVYKSDPNILETNEGQNKKKSKDRERRKSITKLITDFFTKKSPSSSGSKGLFSKLSPKSKEMSKSCSILDFKKAHLAREAAQRKCLSESFINRNASPPPVPPLPVNYTRKTDESSDGEEKHGKHDSSCDTLDLTGISTGSMAGRRSTKSRRVSRQAQLKRHRMAQELQRKLEETEVKMKELEDRGVLVEKSLRGEASFDPSKDEADLLQEWFDLMRDRTELRRFERELTVRAQELELEDRHARLQHELRERIENDKPKTKEDVETEESIINEMIEIVEKRDSLISEIEEDRLRFSSDNINQSDIVDIDAKKLITSACFILVLSYLFWVVILFSVDF
ncbi:F-actin-monooxygenase Mical isoform X7 [Diabrotica virgifera virgifera]|uniref:F-actin monooxygenase n=1 Tax=Diabrotica virgifera virgifera TaxID=50390 RepID=A0A6P7H205_DIAVI|nr:F-actin-monooxygenase Mical isoform X7 [Diabrotica virgifera virgifera]